MAVFEESLMADRSKTVLGEREEYDSDKQETKKLKEEINKRHYKKDSMYIDDLYTIAYPEDSIETDEFEPDEYLDGGQSQGTTDENENEEKYMDSSASLYSLQVMPSTGGPLIGSRRLLARQATTHTLSPSTSQSGSKSLMQLHRSESVDAEQFQRRITAGRQNIYGQKDELSSATATCSVLETNLPKILARRIQEGQAVPYKTTKLLTKAYYQILRNMEKEKEEGKERRRKGKQHQKDPQLSWETLLHTDIPQLGRIVSGYSTIVDSLNDELLHELHLKDDLSSQQDDLLEKIGELTNTLV